MNEKNYQNKCLTSQISETLLTSYGDTDPMLRIIIHHNHPHHIFLSFFFSFLRCFIKS